jgi:hypothetical protein
MAHQSATPRSAGAMRLLLRLIAFVGLAIDAYVHFDLASGFDANTATISEGTLFRIEASAAVVAAVLVVAVRRWITDVFAFLVAATGFAVLMIYRYVDIGAFGPFPGLYEPIWYTKKTLAAVAEGVAAVVMLPLVLRPRRRP